MPITPSAQYSLTLRVEIDHRPGMLGKVASAIGGAGRNCDALVSANGLTFGQVEETVIAVGT